jgi:hypothetical protein
MTQASLFHDPLLQPMRPLLEARHVAARHRLAGLEIFPSPGRPVARSSASSAGTRGACASRWLRGTQVAAVFYRLCETARLCRRGSVGQSATRGLRRARPTGHRNVFLRSNPELHPLIRALPMARAVSWLRGKARTY